MIKGRPLTSPIPKWLTLSVITFKNCYQAPKMMHRSTADLPKKNISTMTVQWQYNDSTMTVQWQYNDSTKTVQRQYNDSTMTVQWQYNDSTMTVQWRYNDSTMTVQWQYNDHTKEAKITTILYKTLKCICIWIATYIAGILLKVVLNTITQL